MSEATVRVVFSQKFLARAPLLHFAGRYGRRIHLRCAQYFRDAGADMRSVARERLCAVVHLGGQIGINVALDPRS